MKGYEIRPLEPQEVPLLRDFLFEAIYRRNAEMDIDKTIIDAPNLRHYIEDFGREDDYALVAIVDSKPVGAVWTRIFDGEPKGYGYIDGETPEFTIALYREYRGLGLGTEMMEAMLKVLREAGYKKASLSVQKENPGVSLYQKLGFKTCRENEEDYVMVIDL